jgi:hypothetical protein
MASGIFKTIRFLFLKRLDSPFFVLRTTRFRKSLKMLRNPFFFDEKAAMNGLLGGLYMMMTSLNWAPRSRARVGMWRRRDSTRSRTCHAMDCLEQVEFSGSVCSDGSFPDRSGGVCGQSFLRLLAGELPRPCRKSYARRFPFRTK